MASFMAVKTLYALWECLGLMSTFQLWLQLTAKVYPVKQQYMVQLVGHLPSTLETWVEVPTLASAVNSTSVRSWLLEAFRKWNSGWELSLPLSACFSLSPSFSASQIHKHFKKDVGMPIWQKSQLERDCNYQGWNNLKNIIFNNIISF